MLDKRTLNFILFPLLIGCGNNVDIGQNGELASVETQSSVLVSKFEQPETITLSNCAPSFKSQTSSVDKVFKSSDGTFSMILRDLQADTGLTYRYDLVYNINGEEVLSQPRISYAGLFDIYVNGGTAGWERRYEGLEAVKGKLVGIKPGEMAKLPIRSIFEDSEGILSEDVDLSLSFLGCTDNNHVWKVEEDYILKRQRRRGVIENDVKTVYLDRENGSITKWTDGKNWFTKAK